MTDKRVVPSRLAAFLKCDESAQRLFLENGFWKSLNEWTKAAIDARDVDLLKEILQVLLKMPTTFSELTGPGGGLTLTVERLLKHLALNKIPGFGEVEANELKYLCAEVFARWLRLKKRIHKNARDPLRIEIETEDGKKGSIVPLRNRPGYGILAVDGKISVVEMTAFKTPPPSPPHSISLDGSASSTPSSEHSSMSPKSLSSLDEEESKVNEEEMKLEEIINPPNTNEEIKEEDLISAPITEEPKPIPVNEMEVSDPRIRSEKVVPRPAPKVFITSKSRSDNLLQSMLNPPTELSFLPPKKKFFKQKEVAVVRPLVDETCLRNAVPQNDAEMTTDSVPDVGGASETSCDVKSFHKIVNNTPTVEAPKELLLPGNSKGRKETLACSTSNQMSPPKIPDLPPAIQPPPHESEAHHRLQNIEADLGKPRRMVRWWGKDGVKDVHRYQRNEEHIARGYVKEKWTAISVVFSEDELETNYGLDKLIINKEQGTPVPTSYSPHSPQQPQVQQNFPWKLRKINIPPRENPIVVDSVEKHVQRRRERRLSREHNYVPPPNIYTLPPASPTPDFNSVDNHEPVPIIPAHDVTDVPLLEDRTTICDHTQKPWPEPKKKLNGKAEKIKSKKWSPLQFGFATSAFKPKA